MSSRVESLFCKELLSTVLDGMFRTIPSKVDSIPKEQFLAATDDALIEHLTPGLSLLPITLHEDRREMEESEAMVDITDYPGRDTRGGQLTKIKGIRIDISVPFTGGSGLWELAPDQRILRNPRGYIVTLNSHLEGTLHVIKEQPNDVPMERLKPEIESEFSFIRAYLSSQKTQIDKYDLALPHQIRAIVSGEAKAVGTSQISAGYFGHSPQTKSRCSKFRPDRNQTKTASPFTDNSQGRI